MLKYFSGASAFFFLLACDPGVDKDPAPTTSVASVAVFAPNAEDPCLSVLPYPTDLAKNPATGLLAVPYCSTDNAQTTAIKTGLRTLDGFAVSGALYTTVSFPDNTRTLDAATLSAVHVLGAQSGLAVAATVFAGSQETVPPPLQESLAQGVSKLYVQPNTLLKEATQYFVVITDELKDNTGAAVQADSVFTFAKSKEPLIDETRHSRFPALSDDEANALENLRNGFAPMFSRLESLGYAREHIVLAWSFTTQSTWSQLPQLFAAAEYRGGATVVHEQLANPATHPLVVAAGIPTSNLCELHTGHVRLQNLLASNGYVGGSGVVNADYLLTTPKAGGNCNNPWNGQNLVVFVHGLGRCKNDALALANSYAAAGFAVLSVDGPRSGGRAVHNLGDSDLDSCPDQLATPDFISLSPSVDPFFVRDGLREWAVELAQIANQAQSHPLLFSGVTSATTLYKLVVMGHSFGGISATLAATVNPVIDVLEVNAASAGFGEVFAPSIEATIAAQLTAAGVNLSTPEGLLLKSQKTQESVAVFQWVLEPADPVVAAPHMPLTVSRLSQIVSAGGPGIMPDAPLHARSTQEKLATVLGQTPLAKRTFVLTYDNGGATAVCDSATAAVGAVLKPCVEDTLSPRYPHAGLAIQGMQRQLVTFASATPLVCDPNFTVACP